MVTILSTGFHKMSHHFGRFSVPGLFGINRAYREYRAFRALPVERLEDLGLDPDLLQNGSFLNFLRRAKD